MDSRAKVESFGTISFEIIHLGLRLRNEPVSLGAPLGWHARGKVNAGLGRRLAQVGLGKVGLIRLGYDGQSLLFKK